ncbi:hypothetical protein AC578_959 [Pseudocercospora eumusae]|uniref:Heterokaryon incompatibility domain-containing protein n=1 Tax=Pseudocercospora eumusae TaxID=321146 RepID=A0A139HEI8_9PEZI|nr:hypothetical protein AC578_959 [Pseudocercospora eumusae]
MAGRLADLSLVELERRYNACKDEVELAALEEELAVRDGYADSDAWCEAIAKSTPATTVYGIGSQELKSQPFYLSAGDETLCNCCRHLDFRYMVTHRIEEREINLGLLKDIMTRGQCAFCRLVAGSLRSSTEIVLEDHVADESLQVLLHSTPKNGAAFSLFDLTLTLRPGQYRGIGIQKLAANDSANAFEGRAIDPNSIDFETVRSWLDSCMNHESGHNDIEKRDDDTPIFTPTYLIDVLDNCIVETDVEDYRYLALSYVWGGPQPLQLLLYNKQQLLSKNSLLRCEVPATIADAIELVRRLGERYLWVDALCIVQDDLASKEPELRAMDKVYDFAVLTIVAGHGESAFSGIPGVRQGTRKAGQHVENVQGMLLANRLPTNQSTIDKSVWNTRAWTYQERILAKRKLFVSSCQATFICEHTEVELCEDVYSLPRRPSAVIWREGEARAEKWMVNYSSLDQAIPEGAVNTAVYATIVQRFTSRQISFAADILNAFIGVSNRLAPLFKDGFRFGLPKNELDTQLLWQPMGNIERRIHEDTGQPIYPTWSWAGWVGPITGNVGGRLSTSDFELMHDSSDTWFTMDQCRGVSSYPSSKWTKDLWRGYMFWSENKTTDVFYAHPVEKLPFRQAYRPRLLKNEHGSAEILHMRAEVVKFRITGERNQQADSVMKTKVAGIGGIEALVLSNSDSDWVGTVFSPSSIVSDLEHGYYDCIKISTTSTDHSLWNNQPSELMELGKCCDTGKYARTNTSNEQVDILVVEKRDGISYRLGAGICHMQAFADAKPRRIEVLLG